MARPKAQFMKKLAERARADLDAVECRGLEVKLKAVAAAATHPVATVADIMGVTAQTVLRWVGLYREGGVEGLQRRAKAPKPSKLSPKQKAAAISWLRSGKTPCGKP
jgi:transposase